MKRALMCSAVGVALVSGCASVDQKPSMSSAELSECLQPNRRVVVEVSGLSVKPEAKPEAGKTPPPPKPAPVLLTSYVQGNSAFDTGGAMLKAGGQQDLDKFLASLTKGGVKVNSVIVSGHSDRLEAQQGNEKLSEDRAKAVTDYLVAKGVGKQSIFWEGVGAKKPVAVTKFCE